LLFSTILRYTITVFDPTLLYIEEDKMKKAFTLTLVVMLVMVAVPVMVSAQGPTGTYVTGISCVNLDDTATASIVLTFYDSGVVEGSFSDTIPAGGNVQYFTPTLSQIPDNFLGSAVVSSDIPVACSVNTQTSGGTTRVGTSNGVSGEETGPELYAPQIMNALSGWSSYVAVQNASGDAVDVKAYYYNSGGSQVHTETKNVPAYSSHVFYQDDGSLSPNFIGSAKFEAGDGTTNLAGTVNFYNAGTAAGNAQFLSYNTFTAGASTVYGPRVAKNLSGVGYTSGWSCQNLGPGSATVTADVRMQNQATSSTVSASLSSSSLSVGQAWAVYLGDATGTALDAITKGFGSAVMTSSGGDIVCIFNEDNRSTYAGQGSTYSGIPDGPGVTNTLFLAQIVQLGAGSYQGGFQIANTTSNAGKCTYTYSDGTTVKDQPLAANGSNSVFASNHVSDGFNGSAVVTCNRPVVGIYNLSVFGGAGDPFATNNGINQ
jgi:hypothetical protein